MSRSGSKKGADYIDGIYVGGAITHYRRKFRQIGRNVFVIVKPSQMTIHQLEKDPRQVRDLAKKKGLSVTLGEIVKEVLKTLLRKPTSEEMAEYVKARTALLKYVRVEKEKAAIREQKELDASNLRMLKALARNGVLTAKGVVRVPIGCSSDELRSVVRKYDSTRLEFDVGESDIKVTSSRVAKKARSLHFIPRPDVDNSLD